MIADTIQTGSGPDLKEWLARKTDEGNRLYLQPVAFSAFRERPARERLTRERLAGGWQCFSALIVHARASASSKTYFYRAGPAEFQELENCAETRDRFRALTGKRRAYAGLAMDRPHVMGILNATPDSFSGDGLNPGSQTGGSQAAPRAAPLAAAQTAIGAGLAMLKAGASVLDIGGESTRPGADPVSEEVEQERVIPVITGLAQATGACILSVDTRNPVTMATAVRAGAHIINDVTALEHRVDSVRTAVKLRRPVVLMHMKGQPKTMQVAPVYSNVLLDVFDYLDDRVALCVAKGMERSQICVDPGIGFGKTPEHNLSLLANLSLFHSLGCPVLLGASRKSFIGKISAEETGIVAGVEKRLPGSLSAMLKGVQQGVQLHRVHDVAEAAQALRLWQRTDEFQSPV